VKLVVGLGNPGPRYQATRHNAGFRIVERFASRWKVELGPGRYGGCFGRGRLPAETGAALDVGVLQPQGYMNRSGLAVVEALRRLPVDPAGDLLVVFDDVDLPFGRLRVRPGGGSGGHRGLADVIAALGSGDFARLRFGVGRPVGPLETADWVLTPFSAEEEKALEERLAAAADAIECVLLEGVSAAMNRFNREPAADGKTG